GIRSRAWPYCVAFRGRSLLPAPSGVAPAPLVPPGAAPAGSSRRRGRLAALGVALAALAIQLPIYDRWLAWFDEGFIYQIASELAGGAVLYRDVGHIAFPGVFELTAALFTLTGPSALAGRMVAVGLFTISAVTTLALARTVLPLGWAVVAALLFVLSRPWAFPQWQMLHYSTLSITMLAIAAWLMARALPQPSRRQLAGVGVALGA